MNGISAVVATLNRKEELRRLLDSVLQNDLSRFELILVDQNPEGFLDDLVQEYSDRVDIRHLRQAEANQSKARNAGAREARYSIVCFPDDDCWFKEGALDAVNRHFEDTPATELLIINWVQNPYGGIPSGALGKKEIYSFRSVGYVTYVLFFKTECFHALGGFLRNVGIGQFIGGGEDSELTFRAVSRGMQIWYDASILVYHHYIPVRTRPHSVIRARQRGMGMVYAAYDVPYMIIIRGMVAPLLKMVVTLDRRKSGELYNMFRGRMEGFVHTIRNKRQLQETGI